jgi:hypothetical protein
MTSCRPSACTGTCVPRYLRCPRRSVISALSWASHRGAVTILKRTVSLRKASGRQGQNRTIRTAARRKLERGRIRIFGGLLLAVTFDGCTFLVCFTLLFLTLVGSRRLVLDMGFERITMGRPSFCFLYRVGAAGGTVRCRGHSDPANSGVGDTLGQTGVWSLGGRTDLPVRRIFRNWIWLG